jgi:hypothetical protein
MDGKIDEYPEPTNVTTPASGTVSALEVIEDGIPESPVGDELYDETLRYNSKNAIRYGMHYTDC